MNRMIRRELARIAVLLRIPLAVNAGGPPQWNFSIEHSKLPSFQKFVVLMVTRLERFLFQFLI